MTPGYCWVLGLALWCHQAGVEPAGCRFCCSKWLLCASLVGDLVTTRWKFDCAMALHRKSRTAASNSIGIASAALHWLPAPAAELHWNSH